MPRFLFPKKKSQSINVLPPALLQGQSMSSVIVPSRLALVQLPLRQTDILTAELWGSGVIALALGPGVQARTLGGVLS